MTLQQIEEDYGKTKNRKLGSNGTGKIIFTEDERERLFNRKRYASEEDLFFKVLEVGMKSYRGFINCRTITPTLGYRYTARALLLKMMRHKLIRPATEDEKLEIARRQTASYRANVGTLRKYIQHRLSTAFIVTEKGARLFDIMSEMYRLLEGGNNEDYQERKTFL